MAPIHDSSAQNPPPNVFTMIRPNSHTRVSSATGKLPACVSPTSAFLNTAMSEIRFGRMRFLITDRPNAATLGNYIKELRRYRVRAIVRVCEPTYPVERLEAHGVRVFDWEFADGSPPSAEVMEKWLTLVKEYFDNNLQPQPKTGERIVKSMSLRRVVVAKPKEDCDRPKASTPPADPSSGKAETNPPVHSREPWMAVHCVAGLGRAPVLVGIALLEAGMSCEDAVFLIRTNRRGALNDKQLKFLRDYKPTGRLRKLRYLPEDGEGKERRSCAIM